ncbi:hypothetical protein [Vulcanibacillus modesticaldus]|nr:hypothetical protein [Vulcanibacillus modesticaldus]
MNKTVDTSKIVMDRIMNENRWALPVHQHENKISKRLRIISSIIIIFILLGISISFIFIKPTSTDKNTSSSQTEIVETMIKGTDFAKIFSNLDFMVIQKGTVAKIGEPIIYHPEEKRKNEVQNFWILTILSISIITLFMSWLSREENDS